MTGLLDIIMGYDCNVACSYCTITPAMRARALPASAIAGSLRRGRTQGYDRVAFTGGEPTIRPDLLPLVRLAGELGYVGIKVQTNGLLLGTSANVVRLLRAGVTDVHVSVHTHEAGAYEAMVRRRGTHPSMQRALELLAGCEVTLVADLILERDTVPRLPQAIEWLQARGVRAADLWFVSLTDANAARPHSMPRMSDVRGPLTRARAVAQAHGVRLRSLHLPLCILGEHADLAWSPADDRVMVVSPDATFALSDSALTPQVYVPACDECPQRSRCPGLRPDYLQRYGDEEIASARGLPRSRSPTLPLLDDTYSSG